MSDTVAGLLQVGSLVVVLGLVWKPLGDYLAWVYSSPKHWRVEKAVYRLVGVEPDADQRWPVYLRGVLAFSLVGVLFLYLLQRVQQWLPLDQGMAAVPSDIAFNTSISFVTNTNWQAYAGESTMGHLTQMAGLAVQNFLSAAVGIAVAVALIRGFVRARTDQVGNFWVDLTRGIIRVLLPISVVGALVLVAAGTIQNFSSPEAAQTLGGLTQYIPGGPVASQEVIKELGTNGGGFFNANAAHPFENPNALTNWLQMLLILSIPVALTRTFGRLVGDRRQGLAILGTMSLFAIASTAAIWFFEAQGSGAATRLAGMALEGKETRFGIPGSSNYATFTTLTSTGSVNSFHDSYTPLGGGTTIVNMMLGEIAPGGVGSGIYGILVLAIIAVFVAGLMVGRTPEYLRKKITAREIKLVALYILATPFAVLVGTGLALAVPSAREGILNSGPHGLSEVLYAYTSAANNNGSAFGGLTVATPFYNTTLGLAMLIGRMIPICLVLALAGSLAKQGTVPVTSGTLQTHRGLFVGLLAGVIVIVTLLTYFPALALGALAEGL